MDSKGSAPRSWPGACFGGSRGGKAPRLAFLMGQDFGRLLWPRSLAARTALVLLVGLAFVQMAGLTIHAFDRVDLQRLAQMRDIGIRAMSVYREVVMAAPEHRAAVVDAVDPTDGSIVQLRDEPPADPL